MVRLHPKDTRSHQHKTMPDQNLRTYYASSNPTCLGLISHLAQLLDMVEMLAISCAHHAISKLFKSPLAQSPTEIGRSIHDHAIFTPPGRLPQLLFPAGHSNPVIDCKRVASLLFDPPKKRREQLLDDGAVESGESNVFRSGTGKRDEAACT